MTTPCILWAGSVNNGGYGPHRHLWIIANGPPPRGYEIHHKCFVRNCINLDHLEAVPPVENKRMREGAQSNSSTGLRNVFYTTPKGPNTKPYRVQLTHNRKSIHVGVYETLEEADAAAIEAREWYWGI